MFRANLESLPASDLGSEMPSGAHLGNYYVVDRRAVIGPTSIEDEFAFLGGRRLALATVQQCFSKLFRYNL